MGSPATLAAARARQSELRLARVVAAAEHYGKGASIEEIAKVLGVSERSVQRYLQEVDALPRRHPTPRRFTTEEVVRAKAMLDDGASYHEVANTLGRDFYTVVRNVPGYRVLTAKEKSERAVLGRQLARIEKKGALR